MNKDVFIFIDDRWEEFLEERKREICTCKFPARWIPTDTTCAFCYRTIIDKDVETDENE